MRFKLADTNRFYLKGTNNQWLHLATVHYGLREFMAFVNVNEPAHAYIEEVTGGRGPDRIEDDALAEALYQFLLERRVLLIDKPTLPDDEWLRRKA